MKEKETNISFNLIEVIIIILMTTLVVGVSTGIIVFKNYGKIKTNGVISNTNYLLEFENAYNNILNSYVENVDEKDLINAALEGMYNYLGDPYTGYLDEISSDDLTDRLNGYKGIGVEITKAEEGILVVNVFKNGPADLAGLEAGDIIIQIDSQSVKEKNADEAQKMIRNAKNNTIKLIVLRGGITKTLDIDVKEVNVPTIEKTNYNGVGYIKITSFSNKTAEDFKEALESLEKENISSLIIDLRNNGGGYLASSVDIAELFIEKGKKIYGLESKKSTNFYTDDTKESRNYKIGIIMNSASASASEILAAALKESYGATIIGTKSYGKGTVQETKDLISGGMLKYTTAYWLTPNGNKIHGIGITPDIEVNAPMNEEISLDEDIQFQEALKAVK